MIELWQNVATVSEPVEPGELETVGDEIRVLQLRGELAAGAAEVDALLARRPDLRLRPLGERGDLRFLEALPHTRRLLLDLGALYADRGRPPRLTGIEAVPGLERLTLSMSKPMSLGAVAGHPGLRGVSVEGPHRDLEALAEVPGLEDLTLRSTPLRDLSIPARIPGLRALDLKLGGIADLTGLEAMPGLEYLEVWRVRGMRDLSPIAALGRLRFLLLQAMSKVQALPDLSGCKHLEEVVLETMKGITDLAPLAHAPALKALGLYDMPQVTVQSVSVLRGHPALEAARIGTGSMRRNAEIEQLLGLPDEWSGTSYVRRWAA